MRRQLGDAGDSLAEFSAGTSGTVAGALSTGTGARVTCGCEGCGCGALSFASCCVVQPTSPRPASSRAGTAVRAVRGRGTEGSRVEGTALS